MNVVQEFEDEVFFLDSVTPSSDSPNLIMVEFIIGSVMWMNPMSVSSMYFLSTDEEHWRNDLYILTNPSHSSSGSVSLAGHSCFISHFLRSSLDFIGDFPRKSMATAQTMIFESSSMSIFLR